VKLYYYYWQGKFDMVLDMMYKNMSYYFKNYEKIKIGITSSPERRVMQYNEAEWDQMVVKYRTTSLTEIRKIEKILVESYRPWINNMVGGGGGHIKKGPYYLYLVLKK